MTTSTMLRIENNGAEITATNYWDLAEAAAGKILVSCNAGAFRVLIPRAVEPLLPDMATAVGCAVSRGPWLAMRRTDGIEILFDDGTSDPFALHLVAEAFDRLPASTDAGKKFVLSVWRRGKNGPEKAIERPCWYRLVSKVPCLRPWASE